MKYPFIAGAVVLTLSIGAVGYFALSTKQNSPKVVSRPASNLTQTTKSWHEVDAGPFVVSLPPGWNLQKLQGYDSFVGNFVGDGAELEFDFGEYSNALELEKDPKYAISYEMIGGYRAKIVISKWQGVGITGVYFGRLRHRNKLNVSGLNLTGAQINTALKIFRSIRFNRTDIYNMPGGV